MDLLALAFRAGHLDLSMFGDALDDGELFVAFPDIDIRMWAFQSSFRLPETASLAFISPRSWNGVLLSHLLEVMFALS